MSPGNDENPYGVCEQRQRIGKDRLDPRPIQLFVGERHGTVVNDFVRREAIRLRPLQLGWTYDFCKETVVFGNIQ